MEFWGRQAGRQEGGKEGRREGFLARHIEGQNSVLCVTVRGKGEGFEMSELMPLWSV